MYIPEHFSVMNNDEIFAFIEENSFGQLISLVDGRLFSTPMPFLVSFDRTKILGHLAVQNPQHRDMDGQEVLITLQGAHDYISPSWYAAPGVPTWNYQAVHLYGIGRIFTAPERLRDVVDQLTGKYESAFSQPWQPDYKDSMLRGIVGVEVTLTDIQCKYKLSQNRSPQDRTQVVEKLKVLGSSRLAAAMERHEI